ncbi:MAG: hypothetical protein LBG92_07500 [Prevotellaceae bacterium]|jgi:hypothetical protein|nr:hypothetical protein [Prevotellaceae bacterium]
MNKKDEIKNKKTVARRNFLRAFGTVFATGSVVAVSGNLLKKAIDKKNSAQSNFRIFGESTFVSPYKHVASFDMENTVRCFEYHNDRLYIADDRKISIFDIEGNRLADFAVAGNDFVRDIAVSRDRIYLLFPARIDVCSMSGEKLQTIEACSENSDYCSFAISSEEEIFVTDAANKHICKYSSEGNFVKFINSPNRFIIPSYTFGIDIAENIVYCSNSGRHQIEKYTLDGEYIESFGKAGSEAGSFTGCCNPVHIAGSSTGDIITSEKGNPRISCYGKDGNFRCILLDSKLIGNGNKACDVKACGDKLYVATARKVSIFAFDRNFAAQTACGTCAIDCPLHL